MIRTVNIVTAKEKYKAAQSARRWKPGTIVGLVERKRDFLSKVAGGRPLVLLGYIHHATCEMRTFFVAESLVAEYLATNRCGRIELDGKFEEGVKSGLVRLPERVVVP
jgi:hypothetical protein